MSKTVKDLVNAAVADLNEKQEHECNNRIKRLVADIFSSQNEIKKHQKHIEEMKAELAELQMPTPLTME